ncbi:MAG: FAD-binding oxidoreductase [Verrucomicrobia bacterium]|nr:MAG: FAD-binding oxidoreductase [Verrucomicrobiota bacterium]
MNAQVEIDVAALEKELRKSVRGEVCFGDGDRALYSTDSSNYRQIPIGVVIPRDHSDVIATVAACRKFGAPITCRGGGTSLAGQCCNAAVIIDFTKYMNRVIEIDVEKKLARVEPGLILDDLQNKLKKRGLIFGPDPATHSHCAIGGMLGNNSCGVHSVMAEFYGGGARCSDNVREMELLLYDGTIMRVGKPDDAELAQIGAGHDRRSETYTKLLALRDKYAELIRQHFPKIPRRVSGYNLDELLPENGFNVARSLVGTEGTCVIILEATLELIDNPRARSLLVLGYPDIYQAGDHIAEIRKYGPIGLEGIDDVLIEAMKLKRIHPCDLEILPEGKGWLLIEFGGDTKEDADAPARELMAELKSRPDAPMMRLVDDPEHEKVVWEIRDSGLGASARVPNQPDTWEGWEDSAVSPDDIGKYLRDFRALLNKHDYLCTLYGHFGQGLVHTRIDFGLKTHEGIQKYLRFTDEAADLIRRYGGSLSGEHGDGQSRGELLPKLFGEQLVQAFREFKEIWDPDWKMNPGKIVRPYRRDENLRYGEKYDPPQWQTYFKYPKDKGSFSYAMERCVGVGKCRRHEHGTMCPSYMVTREEKHSTRGRARLLWEILNNDALRKNGWRDESVKDALDLCLACKGCKADCPMNVDMATYKAEFLSHYYKHRLRPIHAYAFGLIHVWAQLAAIAPGLVNFVNRAPIVSSLVKKFIGVAPQREMPAFASETFKAWFARRKKTLNAQRPTPNAQGKSVLLWPDTFNNFFHPETAKAAVEVLEDAGFHIAVPEVDLCCGRPLYDYGMLDTAKRWLAQILAALRSEIEAGTPMVGLEPSCTAVFRDELTEIFPQNEQAIRLSQQTFTFAEFFKKFAPEYEPPKLTRRALLHGHCHHKAIMKIDADKELLKEVGLDFEVLDSGCCGMAGAFGFEKDHYDVSVACGERMLLPEVRRAAKDTLIIADGFSCREQIRQMSERQALHTAQVLRMAINEGPRGPSGNFPEQKYVASSAPTPSAAKIFSIAAITALGIAAIARFFKGRRNK